MKIDFDEENIYNDPFGESEKLEPSVKKVFNYLISEKAADYLSFIDKCESPIERILGLYLKNQEDVFERHSDYGCFVIYPQHKIKILGGNEEPEFRLDFFVNAVYEGCSYNIAIECDGHEFHERTKEQVEKDNKRTRMLQRAGFIVLRFSGSEILKNPAECAREINYIVFGKRKFSFVEDEE